MIIACDVDGVLAELQKEVIRRYNLDYHDTLSISDILSWDMALYVKPECGTKIYEYFSAPNLYDDLSMIDGSLEGVNLLEKMGHRVVYVTTPAPKTSGAKEQWLRQRGFLRDGSDYVECHDKSLIRASVLIDDGAHNLRVFTGERILFNQPWNKSEYVDGAWRADGWAWTVEIIRDQLT